MGHCKRGSMMYKKFGPETKVGLFAILCIVIISYATIKVSDRSIIAGGSYKFTVIMDTAIGLKTKTPVEISGIQVGVVSKISLDENDHAKVTLSIGKGVRIPEGTKAYIRSKGFLGEIFVELRPGPVENPAVASDSELPYGGVTGDVNMLLTQFNDIAKDVKSVTGSLKEMIGSDNASPVYRAVQNLDSFTAAMKDVTVSNEANLNRIIYNLATLTDQLKNVVQDNRANIDNSLANISDVTNKIASGEGTIGKLVNDDATVNKMNDVADNLNETLGGLKKLETEIGYHGEYLGGTHDFKQYVHLNLMPAPDKGFLFEFVSDPQPSPNFITRNIDIAAGGATSAVRTTTATIEKNQFRFSAELAKKFYDFTFRGGVIESTGGVGLDFDKGPVGLKFSAFNFGTEYGQKPHLKAWGNINITKSLYLMGGMDDFINPNQPKDWFLGAGIRLVDDDIKSLIGLGAAKAVR